MTVPFERTNAVINAEAFLKELLDPKKTPRVPKHIRMQAGHILRHFPTAYDMEEIALREDGAEHLKLRKIFGRGFV